MEIMKKKQQRPKDLLGRLDSLPAPPLKALGDKALVIGLTQELGVGQGDRRT